MFLISLLIYYIILYQYFNSLIIYFNYLLFNNKSLISYYLFITEVIVSIIAPSPLRLTLSNFSTKLNFKLCV